MEFIEITAKTVDDAITEACRKLSVTSDKLEYDVIDEGSAGFLGIGSRSAVIKAKVKSSVQDIARSFLNDVFEAMNLTVVIEIKYDELDHFMEIDLQGMKWVSDRKKRTDIGFFTVFDFSCCK